MTEIVASKNDLIDAIISKDKQQIFRIIIEYGYGDNFHFMVLIVKKYSDSFLLASDRLKHDIEFINICINNSNIHILQYIPDDLKNNNSFMFNIIQEYPYAIIFASNELKKNKEFLFPILKMFPFVIQLLSPEINIDREFIDLIIKENIIIKNYISNEMMECIINNDCDKNYDKYYCIIENVTIIFSNLYKELSSNEKKEVLLKIIKNNPLIYDYIKDEFKNDDEFKLKAF
jgi:hypothetical protein